MIHTLFSHLASVFLQTSLFFWLSCLFFLFIGPFSYGHQKEDTLRVLHEVLQSHPDIETELATLNEIAFQYRRGPFDSAYKYANAALVGALAAGDRRQEADAYNRLGMAYRRTDKKDSCLYYQLLAYEIEKDLGDAYGIARAANQLGNCYRDMEDYLSATQSYEKAASAFRRLSRRNSLGISLRNLAFCLRKLNRLDTIATLLTEAIDIHREQEDVVHLLQDYVEVGRFYLEVPDYQKADEALKQAEILANQLGDARSKGKVKLVQGSLALLEKDFPMAATMFQDIIYLYEGEGIMDGKASVFYNLGSAKLGQDSLQAARNEFDRALEWAKYEKDTEAEALALNGLGSVALRRGDNTKALGYYEKSYQVLRSEGPTYAVHALLNLAKLHEQLGNTDEALKFRKQYESLFQEIAGQARAAESRAQDVQVKNAEVALARNDQIRVKDRERFIWIGASLATLLFFGIGFTLFFRKRARLATREATLQKERVELERDKAKLEAEEITKRRIARDIHDDLGNTLSLIRMHFEAVENSMDKQQKEQTHHYQEAFKLLGQAVQFSRNVAEELDPVTLKSFGLLPALKEVQNSLNGVNGLQVHLLPFYMQERLPLEMERNLYQIIRELTGNVVKHAKATALTIQLVRRRDTLSISIEDNGLGFDPDNSPNPKGNGLTNIHTRVAAMGGRVLFDSRPSQGSLPDENSGTSIVMDIPLPVADPLH